jgi:hypothetical protein
MPRRCQPKATHAFSRIAIVNAAVITQDHTRVYAARFRPNSIAARILPRARAERDILFRIQVDIVQDHARPPARAV